MPRHSLEQTWFSSWTYSQYTHLLEMSPLATGARVRIGDDFDKTSNTGKQGCRVRRDALRFPILANLFSEWSNDGDVLTPKDTTFTDPSAFYRLEPCYASQAVRALPEDQRAVPVPNMTRDQVIVPAGSKEIWLYAFR